MTPKRRSVPVSGRTVWAYSYEIVPPQPEERLRHVRALLDGEHELATDDERTWEARFVRENRVTHILVVTDRPDQGREINLRVEAGLKSINAGFALTSPLVVGATPGIVPLPPGAADGD